MEYTDRMGLTVRDMSDELSACRENWDRLETAYSGSIIVTPGTFPDSSILYDGAIVEESTTGKVWRALKNQNGIFTQTWIKYPWLFVGKRVGSFVTRTAWTRFPLDPASTPVAKCVNSGADDIDPSGNVVVPITALYAFSLTLRIEPNGDDTGYRTVGLTFNQDISSPVPMTEYAGSIYREPCKQLNKGMFASVVSGQRHLSKGTRVAPACYNTGLAITEATGTIVFLSLAVIRPL